MPDDQIKVKATRLPQPQPEPEPNAQTKRFYANYAGVATMPEEFVLRFAERDLNDSGHVTELARIYLSLPHAKRLATAMIRSLKAYEEIFGDITADPLGELSPENKKKLGIEETQQQ